MRPNGNNTNTNTNSLDIQNIVAKSFTSEKYIAYEVFGKCDPVLLISGASTDMNAWEPHTVLPKCRK
jgi:hypothetical protein